MQVELFKSVIQQQRQRFSPVSLTPIALIADEDTDFRRPVKVIDVDKADITEQLISRFVDDAVIVILSEFF